jgi:hypothetical protein
LRLPEPTALGRLPTRVFVPLRRGVSDAPLLYPSTPNPASKSVHVSWEQANGSEAMLDIVDMLGHELRTEPLGMFGIGKHDAVFSVQDLPVGVYGYRVRTLQSVGSGRFVVARSSAELHDNFFRVIAIAIRTSKPSLRGRLFFAQVSVAVTDNLGEVRSDNSCVSGFIPLNYGLSP